MFLATTALTEFWDKSQELLYLGLWCLPREKMEQWHGARGKVMPSPWDEPGRTDLLARQCSEDIPERLVDFLSGTLGEMLGVSRSPRYWRILLKPWALSHVALIADHWLHLDAAFRREPRLATIALDPQDYVVSRDSGDRRRLLLEDSYHLQIFSELIAGMGKSAQTRRLAADAKGKARSKPPASESMTGEVLRGGLRLLRSAGLASVYFGGPGLDRAQIWPLIKRSQGRILPVGESLPRNWSAAPEAARRARLAEFPANDFLEKLVARTLPTHLPTLFLEGFTRWREHVVSRWSTLPKRLIATGSWQSDDYLRMLAAEGVERGGRLAFCQEDGSGLLEAAQVERHQREVAEQYWTWGWTEGKTPGATLKPMPDPELNAGAPKKTAASAGEVALVGTSLPRYAYPDGFDLTPLWHRFYDYLKERERYVAALPQWARDTVRLRLDAPDHGWGHMERIIARFPAMRCEPGPWQENLHRIRLIVIDHPLLSPARALTHNIPTLLFWNPLLWKTRPAAKPALDALRSCGILHDTPESAATQTSSVLKDPLAWWRGAAVQQARAEFCRAQAQSHPDWAKIWIKAAQEI